MKVTWRGKGGAAITIGPGCEGGASDTTTQPNAVGNAAKAWSTKQEREEERRRRRAAIATGPNCESGAGDTTRQSMP